MISARSTRCCSRPARAHPFGSARHNPMTVTLMSDPAQELMSKTHRRTDPRSCADNVWPQLRAGFIETMIAAPRPIAPVPSDWLIAPTPSRSSRSPASTMSRARRSLEATNPLPNCLLLEAHQPSPGDQLGPDRVFCHALAHQHRLPVNGGKRKLACRLPEMPRVVDTVVLRLSFVVPHEDESCGPMRRTNKHLTTSLLRTNHLDRVKHPFWHGVAVSPRPCGQGRLNRRRR